MGLRGSWGSLQYELFVGAPINRPERFSTSATTTGFSLNYNY
jgi:hemolysin activation/secretion protein